MASAYFKNGSLIESFTSTATAAGTLTLTAASNAYQVFTGTTTHIVKLPDATTMIVNQKFEIINSSTGVITIQDNSSTVLGTIEAGVSKVIRATDISTSTGVFDITVASSSGGGSVSAAEAGQLAAAGAAGFAYNSKSLSYKPQEIGGNYWTAKASLPAAKQAVAAASLNGFLYGMGGRIGGTIQSTVAGFSDDNNYWLARAAMTAAGYQAGFSDGISLFSCGGYDSGFSSETAFSQKYTDSTNTWSSITSLLFARAYLAGTYYNGFGYTVGGYKVGQNYNETQQYSVANNAWYLRAPLGVTKYNNFCIAAPKGIWTGNGAISSGTSQTDSYFYDDSINAWSAGPTIPGTAVQGQSAFSNNDRGYVWGGANGGVTPLAQSASIDFASKSWVTVAAITTPVFDACASGATLNALGYQVGGAINNGPTATANVFSYTPADMINVGELVRSKSSPASLSVAVLLNALAPSVRVQVRSDGDNWKTFMSGGSSLKLNETLNTKFGYTPGGFCVGYSGNAKTEQYNEAQNVWKTRADQPAQQHQSHAFWVDGFGFMAGGYINTSSNITAGTIKFNDITNAYTSVTSMTSAGAQGFGMPLLGKGYAINGGSNDAGTTYHQRTLQYDATANSWTAKTAPGYASRSSMGGIAIADRAVIAGGSNGSAISTTQIYDPVADSWTTSGNLASTLIYMGQSEAEGYGFSLGGTAPNQNTQRFDIITGTWTAKSTMNTARYDFTPFRLNGNLYAAGGTNALTSSEQYSVAVNVWTAKASLSNNHSGSNAHGAGPYRNYELRVAVPTYSPGVGGWIAVTKTSSPTNLAAWGFGIRDTLYAPVGDAGGAGTGVAGVFAYNALLDAWRQTQNCTYTAAYCGAMTLQGFGYLVGGRQGGPSYITNSARFDPELNTWASTGSLGSGIGYPAAAALNGAGYTLGGFNGSTVTTVNKFNVSTNSWATAGNLQTSRYSLEAESCGGFIFLGGNTSLTFERYNDASQTTTLAANVLSLNTDGAALSKGDRFFYLRGSDTYEYNTSTNVWATKPALSTNRYYMAAANLGGNFQLAGGSTGSSVNEAYVDSIKSAALSASLTVS